MNLCVVAAIKHDRRPTPSRPGNPEVAAGRPVAASYIHRIDKRGMVVNYFSLFYQTTFVGHGALPELFVAFY